jgi:hypothetical protein
MTDQVLCKFESDDQRWPALERHLEVEATILGGGILGLGVAHFLQERRSHVALLQARRIDYGATARSTALEPGEIDPVARAATEA